MGKQTIDFINAGTTNAPISIADLKLRVAEHILAQYDCCETSDVQNILDETKVGAWRRPTLQKMLKMVFSTA